ncbi:MAG: molybdopterin cofactor-binding domain-containing protein, partial [bacterium]
AAETPEACEEACERIKVEYEELEPLLDPINARKSHIKLWGDDNTFKHYKIRKGDVEKGFEESDVIVEATYKTPYQEHAYLEPQTMVAIPLPDGGMEIRGSMQCPFYVQEGVCEVLGVELAKVRVIQMETGGGFGGKEDVPSIVGAQAALAA